MDNGLKPQIVRVTEEIDKSIKHRRDIANPSRGMPLFPWLRIRSTLQNHLSPWFVSPLNLSKLSP
jgi:hypothetical protein